MLGKTMRRPTSGGSRSGYAAARRFKLFMGTATEENSRSIKHMSADQDRHPSGFTVVSVPDDDRRHFQQTQSATTFCGREVSDDAPQASGSGLDCEDCVAATPRVVLLRYNLQCLSVTDSFERAPRMMERLGSFSIDLVFLSRLLLPGHGTWSEYTDYCRLFAFPMVHFADVSQARAQLEPLLRDWEAGALVENGIPITFAYTDAETVDLQKGVTFASGNRGDLPDVYPHITVSQHDSFPRPHTGIQTTDVVPTLLMRLRHYRSGAESIYSFGYFLITFVERLYGGQQGAAQTMHVSRNLLGELRRLSNVPDATRGRKAASDHLPLSHLEHWWMEQVALALIRRVAEHEAGVEPLKPLTRADFDGLTARS